MRRLFGFHSEEMALTLLLWLCCLPIVGLVVIPLFGLMAAGFVALVLLLVAMLVCWLLCGWKIAKG
jgi:hypothetical protein